jgi:hypothetical protein
MLIRVICGKKITRNLDPIGFNLRLYAIKHFLKSYLNYLYHEKK